MKSLLYLLLLITTNLECYSQLLFGKNDNGIQIANITGITSDFIINNQYNENILYSNFEGQRIRLLKLPQRSKFLILKIWGKLKISDEKKISKSISSLRLWKNPNLLVAPKIYHHHYPKLDSETGMHHLQIPLGRTNFVSTQQFHFSLPTWNLAKIFEVKKIEVVSTKLPGTQVSIDQNLIETNINELFTEQQWINKFQFIDEWFVLIITCQVILAFALIRYYMFAQAYLCLMFFCLLASYWYQWPFQYDVKKSLLAEANFKLRQIVRQAIDIPKKVEYELNQDIDSLIEGIKSSNFKSQNSKNIINKLSDEAEKLGLEILLEYRDFQRIINLSDSTRRSLNKPILIKLLGVIRTLIQEYVGLQREKKQDAEQNDRFNKKLEAIEDLFEGLFGSDQSLITLLNSSKRLIRVQTNEISKEHFLYWTYFWDSDGTFVVVLCRLKSKSYYRYIENYLESYFSKALEVVGWEDHRIYFRNKYGSAHSSKLDQSYKLAVLHESMAESTEFLHYEFQQNSHQLHYGSIFESTPNQRIILSVNASSLANELLNEIRQLSLYKIAMIGLIPFLALLISGLVSWRLSILRRKLVRMNLSGDLERLKVEGRDQISDLSIQVNRLLNEPLKRDYLVKLKKELQEYHARFLNFPSHNNNDRDDLVYIILENTTGTIPKMLADNVVWMCKDYKDRLTGWCSLLELIKVISEADISSKNNMFRDCKLSILRVDFEISRNPFGAVTEVPSIIPILSGEYRPYIDATSEKNINFRIFTTLEQKYRDMLLSVLDGFQEWEEIESEGLNGYYLL